MGAHAHLAASVSRKWEILGHPYNRKWIEQNTLEDLILELKSDEKPLYSCIQLTLETFDYC